MVARISDEAFIALAAAVALLSAADAYVVHQLRVVAQDTTSLNRYVAESVGVLRQHSALLNDDQQDRVQALALKLADDRRAAEEEARLAQIEAQRHAGLVTGRMARASRRLMDWAKSELSGLRETSRETDETASRLARQIREARLAAKSEAAEKGSVAAAATAMRTDAAALHAAARKQSEEIASARPGTGRRIFEFHLKKDGQIAYFEGVSLKLREVSRERNRYGLGIEIGGSRIRARDCAALEPVRLISSRGSPIEVVVKEIGESEVHGILSLPRRSDTATGGYSIAAR
ncbi:MAG TPA: hypothetical protein VF767_08900 [Bryobacteraceae bacterium]